MRITMVLILLLCCVSQGADLPYMLTTRIEQMGLMKTRLLQKWPKKENAKFQLFQGLRIKVDSKVETKADHLALIAEIPKELLHGMKVTETIETDGWFYSSVEFDGVKATWMSVIATRKGGDEIVFSYTW